MLKTPPTTRIQKCLIANRGEIACRVIRTCKILGIRTVAVFSEADADALHVKMADEAVFIGPPVAALSYLDSFKLIAACLQTGSQAVHPGYGFLSENAEFARQCSEAGIIFIGPHPESILAIGDKISSKQLLATKAPEVPLLPGYNGSDQSIEALVKEALRIGFPVLLKASAGGGGKGMRVVRNAEQLKEEISAAQGEAKRSFGDSRVLIEKFVETARHIEIQIFGDTQRNSVALFERECSVQRRHQKIIEECPSPFLTPSLREKMTRSALSIANLISYVGAGTVEFIVDGKTGNYYFLEVNTRLQVEHPVTEAVTGLDLVEMQFWVAQGGSVHDFIKKSGGLRMNGHAIECRIYAEDADNEFFPATGKIVYWKHPIHPSVRSDTGIEQGSEITSFYDPLVTKLTVHGSTRAEAIYRMRCALSETVLFGLPAHNISFLIRALSFVEFETGKYDTNIVKGIQGYESDNKAHFGEDAFKSFLTSVLGATMFVWVKRYAKSLEDVSYRRVRTGFRNVPYKWQQIQFGVLKPIHRIQSKRVLVEYNHTIEYDSLKKSPTFEMRVLLPSVKGTGKNGSKPAQLLLETTATVHSSTLEPEEDGWQHGVLRIAIDGVLKSLRFSSHEKKLFCHSVDWNGTFFELPIADRYESSSGKAGSQDGILITPMPCRIISISAVTGTNVSAGDTILTIESMKMETKVKAPISGVVTVKVKEGEMLKAGEAVAIVDPK